MRTTEKNSIVNQQSVKKCVLEIFPECSWKNIIGLKKSCRHISGKYIYSNCCNKDTGVEITFSNFYEKAAM